MTKLIQILAWILKWSRWWNFTTIIHMEDVFQIMYQGRGGGGVTIRVFRIRTRTSYMIRLSWCWSTQTELDLPAIIISSYVHLNMSGWFTQPMRAVWITS